MNLSPSLLDLTLNSPAANLACDEALFLEGERARHNGVLRFWVPDSTFVVVGYTNAIEREVNVELCRSLRIPILRRCTGGGAVVQMPGCLNFTLVLPYRAGTEYATIASTNRTIMEKVRTSCAIFGDTEIVTVEGISDLALNGMKFCGNAQRRGESCLLFHGVILCNADLQWISRLLPMPSRQPGYRHNRPHAGFVTNLNIAIDDLKPRLADPWITSSIPLEAPHDMIRDLVSTKYTQDSWNFKR